MSDKVLPDANGHDKPRTPPPGAGQPLLFPRPRTPAYVLEQLPPPRSRRRRRRRCSCPLISVIVVFVLIVLLGLAGGIFYAIYQPKRPTFSASSFRLVAYKLSSNNQLFSRFEVNVTTDNPSRNGFSYVYNPTTIRAFAGDVCLGKGYFPAFVHSSGETRSLGTSVRSKGEVLNAKDAKQLREKNEQEVTLKVDTVVRIKVGTLKTQTARVHIRCGKFSVSLPEGESPAPAPSSPATAAGSCHVDVKVKILKWYV